MTTRWRTALRTDTSTYRPVLILALLTLLAIGLRISAYYEPLERDIAMYAVMAHEWLNGRALYADLWDIKPPAIYLTFAGAEWLFGYGSFSVFILNNLAALLSLFGLYQLAYLLTSGNTRAGLWAAAVWAVIAAYLPLEANQPNTEVFINSALIWALVWFTQAVISQQIKYVWWSAMLFVLASTYKQVAVLLPMLLGLFYIAMPVQPLTRSTVFKYVFVIGMVGVVIWLAIFAYFWLNGSFSAFYEAVFAYNFSYAAELAGHNNAYQPTGIHSNLVAMLSFPRLFPDFFGLRLPLLAFSAIGLIYSLRVYGRLWLVVLAYVVAIPIMIALPGKFFPHYYQLWLPALALCSGVGILAVAHVLQGIGGNYIKIAYGERSIGIAFLVGLLVLQMPFLRMTPTEQSIYKYGDIFVQAERSAKEIQFFLAPDDTFFQLGFDASLYFYSQRKPASGVISNPYLSVGPFTEKYTFRVLADLKQAKPELLVVPMSMIPAFNNPERIGNAAHKSLFQWIAQAYVAAPGNDRRSSLYQWLVRKNGTVLNRLTKARIDGN